MYGGPSEQQSQPGETSATPRSAPFELPVIPLEQLGGWGFHTAGVTLSPHGPAILISPLPQRKTDRHHLMELACSEMHRPALNSVGIRWHYTEHCLEIPLGSTLQRFWNDRIVSGSDLPFRIQPIPAEIQSRDQWRRMIAQGQFPVSEYGPFLVHDVTDHVPAVLTLDSAFARSFQSRLAFLIALDDRLTTACPQQQREMVRKLLLFHEQQIEIGTVQISINLGHLPKDPARAERNIAKVYERLQKWPSLLAAPDDGSQGDLQFLCEAVRQRLQQAEAWDRDCKKSFHEALGLTSWNEHATRHLSPTSLAKQHIDRLTNGAL